MTNTLSPRDVGQPTWSAVFSQMSWASGVSAEIEDSSLEISGVLTRVLVNLSTSTNLVNAKLTITDADGFEIYWGNFSPGNPMMDVCVPVDGVLTVGVTPSGDPGASGITADIKFYGE